jgi:hypothetical protein
MKNLHLIPTNKPSKLYKVNNNLYFEEYPNKTVNAGNQHIYITSDEEIKEGWSYDRMMKSIGKRNNVYSSKIILTTDLELQKDGVQAIDDEFLEWFVKNPSCEEVEVKKGKMKLNDDGEEYGFPDMSLYKIIIPNEEQNKETLKEAAENYIRNEPDATLKLISKYSFKDGAKWMQERMYSEEEVQNLIKIIEWYDDNSDVRPNCDKEIDGLTMWDWFEQFKKK